MMHLILDDAVSGLLNGTSTLKAKNNFFRVC